MRPPSFLEGVALALAASIAGSRRSGFRFFIRRSRAAQIRRADVTAMALKGFNQYTRKKLKSTPPKISPMLSVM